MGEKGIGVDVGSAVEAVAGQTGAVSTNIVERATTLVTTTAATTATDLVDVIKDKGVAAAADTVIAEGRDRLKHRRKDSDEPETDDPDTAPEKA